MKRGADEMSKGKVKWSDLEMAFEFVDSDTFSDNSAYVSRSTGKTFWEGDAVVDLEEHAPVKPCWNGAWKTISK